jgi:two-component system, NtrC family, response regulator AtoC
MVTILVAEDEPDVRAYLGLALQEQGYNVEFAQNGEEVVRLLQTQPGKISLLLMDLMMPLKDGFQTLKEVRQGWPALPVITLSGHCTPANVATVLKGGAIDFLSKPIAHDDLLRSVQAGLKVAETLPGTGIVAHEPLRPERAQGETWSQRCEALLNQVGASDVPVLLRGETGVGKEVLARKLHEQSKRAGRPFLKLNCAALPYELVESELFGYEKGAFTGAFKNSPGKFEMANHGTILLDEIGDMDFRLQAKLLQVLQDREFLRLGAHEMSRVDVRVMAATHCDLEKAIRQSRFREDLYYRLNIIEVQVPPLRERKDEVIELATTFIQKFSPSDPVEITPVLKRALLDYNWPGNVRELENVIRKFLIIRSGDAIAADLNRKSKEALAHATASHSSRANGSGNGNGNNHWSSPANQQYAMAGTLEPIGAMRDTYAPHSPREDRNGMVRSQPADYRQPVASTNALQEYPTTLADVDDVRKKAERETIVSALNATLWNRKKAATMLRIDYKALLYKMKKLGIGEKFPLM